MGTDWNDEKTTAKKWYRRCGENIFGVKIVIAGTCAVNVDWSGRADEGGGTTALGSLAEKCEEIRYLRRIILHWGVRSGGSARNPKVAATSQDGADCGLGLI